MICRADVMVTDAGPGGSTAAKLPAGQGTRVILLGLAIFPRHKICASWINRPAFERFATLNRQKENLVEYSDARVVALPSRPQ